MAIFIWSEMQGIVFHIGWNVALNFSKPLRLINNYTYNTSKKSPAVCDLILLAAFN